MEEVNDPPKGHRLTAGPALIDVVFSWSVRDLLNQNLYNNKVKQIPTQFSSASHYFGSFVYPLVEETRADLASAIETVTKAPATEILSLEETKDFKPPSALIYKIEVHKKKSGGPETTSSDFATGDLLALTDMKPRCIDDLHRPGKPFKVCLVTWVDEDDPSVLTIRSSKPLIEQEEEHTARRNGSIFGKLLAIYLINITTNMRIWRALVAGNGAGNSNIIQNVLRTDSLETCDHAYLSETCCYVQHARSVTAYFGLDESQEASILSCVSLKRCTSAKHFKLIWGPPGTGKTKTVASLLFALLKMKSRTVACAPTNIAVIEITSRVMKLVYPSIEMDTYGVGDVVLFGNEERMKIIDHDELKHVFLDHRADKLYQCCAPFSGWRNCLQSMISLLKDPAGNYRRCLKQNDEETEAVKNEKSGEKLTLAEFMEKTFKIRESNLKKCMKVLYTHLPTSFISSAVVSKMILARSLMNTIASLLEGFKANRKGSGLQILSPPEFRNIWNECLQVLNFLSDSFTLPEIFNGLPWKPSIKDFCLQNATLIFCTASSSAKLQTVGGAPFEFLVIDEAAQLKECESAIPLQLPGLNNAVLIGDEQQLPAMVKSKISDEAGFGTSLFQRQVLLGRKKHLLNTQYRMHPSISKFPKWEFYDGKLLDAPNVMEQSYEKHFLKGKMYGTFSFIDVQYGNDECGQSHSKMNLVEVSVVVELVEKLFKESVAKNQKVSVGVISLYNAQVYMLMEKLGKKYTKETKSGFSLSIRSVDGYQGGEDDVIIISTVRCNRDGSIGFLSNRPRSNVALTRARHCLWVLGCGATLLASGSVWSKLVTDAKLRGCFYDASDDSSLAMATTIALLELNQVSDLIDVGPKLLTNMRWKVFYSDQFWRSMVKIQNAQTQKMALLLLEKLSRGWRLMEEKSKITVTFSQILKAYNVGWGYKLVWTVDAIQDNSSRLQVLKIWDIVPPAEAPKIVRYIGNTLRHYSAQKIIYCNTKRLEGNLEVPVRWQEEAKEDFLSSSLASLCLTDEPESGHGIQEEIEDQSEE